MHGAKLWWSPPDGKGHTIRLIPHAEAAAIEINLGSPKAPTFSVSTLDALLAIFEDLRAAADRDLRYLLLTSSTPRIFSMGGDLGTIAALARSRDRAAAGAYGRKAALVIHALYDGLGLDLVTTACVDGKAYGAGFEAVLASTRAVARQGSTFCLPESRFGLFPGMGATSFLARRIGHASMERMLGDRTVLIAEDAARLGLIAVETDGDPAALEIEAARSGGEARWARLAAEARARREREGFTLDEVQATTADWAARVATMAPTDLAALERVATVQRTRSGATPS